MTVPQVIVVLGRCTVSSGLTFGIRLELRGGDNWVANWAFPVPAKVAGREGYDRTEVTGSFALDDREYPGCPGCGQFGVALCGSCDKLSCWNPAERTNRCPWCGVEGTVGGQITALRAGGDI